MTNEARWTPGTHHEPLALAEARRRWGSARLLTGPARPPDAPPPLVPAPAVATAEAA